MSAASLRRIEGELLLVLALFALPLGWGIHWGFAGQARDAVAAHGWPTASGVVTESSVVHTRSADVPSAIVRYDYTVAGRRYSGSGVTLSIATFDGEPAHEVVARYPPGREVRVLYDPADPTSCTLEQTELDLADRLLLALGKALRWGGAACVVLALVLDRLSRRGAA